MGTLTLEEQQHQVLTYLSTALEKVRDQLTGYELGQVIASRLKSGDRVFKDRMFTWQAGELFEESIEELADAILYYCAHLYVSDHGPVREREDAEVKPFAVGDRVSFNYSYGGGIGNGHILAGHGVIVDRFGEGHLYDWMVTRDGGTDPIAMRESEMKHA